MIGILGGMGTQAGLDFCNKLAMLNRGKSDQEYPLFMLYNKSNIPGRPESIEVQTRNLFNKKSNKKSKKQLMFLEPIDKSMSVDEIYFKLIEIFKKKGIKIYPDKKDVN